MTHSLPPSLCLPPFALDLIPPLSCLPPSITSPFACMLPFHHTSPASTISLSRLLIRLRLTHPYPPSALQPSVLPTHSWPSLPPFLHSSHPPRSPPFLIPSPPIPHPHYLPWYPFTYILYWIIYNVFLYFCISSTFPPPSGCCGGWGEVFVTSLVFV